jgi:conjugal transfer pilus assembly protein TraU
MREFSHLLRAFRSFFVFLSLLLSVPATAAPTTCTGKFVNPITDIDWAALFPVSVGALEIWPHPDDLPDTNNPDSPICACETPVPRIGLAVGFWEPVRLIDATYKPWCFVNLGGVSLDPGFDTSIGVQTSSPNAGARSAHNIAQWHNHYYVYPLIYWLNLLTDFACLEASDVDIAFITEVDPLWHDDVSTALFGPENAAFANILAQTACAADCVSATRKLPNDELFWCAGCWGGLYPMTGNTHHDENLQSGKLSAARLMYFMHRVGITWGTMGSKGLCKKYYMPVMRKQQYRFQMVNPVARTGSRYSTTTLGTSTLMPKSGAVIPVKGEDQGYLIWRKRNCCVL